MVVAHAQHLDVQEVNFMDLKLDAEPIRENKPPLEKYATRECTNTVGIF